MSRTDQLYELQQVDSQLDARLVRVQSVNAALGESDALKAARAQLEEAQAELATRHKKLRSVSTELEDLTRRMETMSKRLFDGSVKNPKELGQIQHDLETAKGVRSTREDALLAAMSEVEEAEKLVAELKDNAGLVETEWRRSQVGLLEEKDRLDEQLKVLHIHRTKLAAEVAWADLQIYDKLRRAKRGVAIAALVNDVCQGCRVQVAGSVLRQARQGTELIMCTSCGRLLHTTGRGDLSNVK